ncbi:MAG TPA: PEP-CTERM sorting domain-containing protein [Verrucomicrobiae bacterium]|nr:PEP-CTERM sorting domain-containing protein [Verrucomicrobiae bacterium]
MKILKKITLNVAGLIIASLTISAQAQSSIDGSISFSGGATLNGPLESATAFTEIIAGINPFPGSETGNYAGISVSTPVTFNPFEFDSSPVSPIPMWTFTVGSTVYSFEIDSLSVQTQNSSFLNIMGVGTAHIDGYTDTQGTFAITDSGLGGPVFTFGAGVNVVPEPATFGCFALGLSILACARRFKKS